MKKIVFIVITILIASLVVLYVIPAFRGEITVSEGFRIGHLLIRYYGLLLGASVLVSWFLAGRFVTRFNLDAEIVERALFWCVISGFVGARALVVLENWSYFRLNLDEILQVWHGGLAIFGGLLGGFLAIIIFARKNHLVAWNLLDLLALVTPLGQAIGRWGNFFNQEAFGPPTTLLWKMYIAPAHRTAGTLASRFFHPTFLYESLWNLLIFGFLLYLSRKSKRPGALFLAYLALYSAARFFLEYLRIDSVRIFSWRINQIVSLVIFLSVIVIWFRRSVRHAKTS